MQIRALLVASLLAACGGTSSPPTTATAASASTSGCPDAVPAAVTKAYPDATQGPCEGESEDGQQIYEIKITRADGSKAEVELTGDGTLVATEEVVAAMPDAVAKAFAAKYPGATASRVEKITMAGKGTQYEIKFTGKEATFSEAGDFVEEEGPDGDKDDGEKDND